MQTFHHTLIIATHDLDLVLDLCPRTLILKAGQLMADGPTRDRQDEELLQARGLEKPPCLPGCPVCQERSKDPIPSEAAPAKGLKD